MNIMETIKKLGMVEDETKELNRKDIVEVMNFVDELMLYNDTNTIGKLLIALLFEKEE